MSLSVVKFAVITVSDRVSRGIREDGSGPLAKEILSQFGEIVFYDVVPDGIEPVQGAIHAAMQAGSNIILTTGGTGITQRDQTPQAVSSLLSFDIPGIAALIREKSKVATAVLSRSIAGVVDDGTYRAAVVTLPGSPNAVAEGISAISELFSHLAEQLKNGDHDTHLSSEQPPTSHPHSGHFEHTYKLAHHAEPSTGIGEVVIAQIQDSPISMDALQAAVSSDMAGAITSFCGQVRNHDHKRGVTGISYSAHPSSNEIIRSIAEKVARERGLHKIAVIHRIGQLTVGDVALGVAVSSDHRKESFQAVEDLVERVKLELPIWKKQEFTDGSSQWSGMA
ncbi:molybdenum cofactor biosynthesis protein MoaE [Arcanobacterium phocisimile]|uniref:Molybdenum cofactor biosynthesis protein MoaE n=1 Tax=Arcanobacterium phocisimile TaxID=1302235 RepID=A0ABX7IFV4_9ACTO|nr:molybdenum cofactor biosynthesis protein MoaE [Arcanobacterium phocisimile]QRV01707.1 molybdenum cofactor biosynthesis protein MoaE [Arcanobacterium phocisimile]